MGSRPTTLSDTIRGAACLVMALYHLGLDLQVFANLYTWPKPFWRWAAEPIGAAFLLCAGAVAALQPARTLRRARKIALIALGLTAVSLTPWFPFPVYFGILHAIALGLLLLALIRPFLPHSSRLLIAGVALLVVSTVASESIPLPYPWFILAATLPEPGFIQMDYWPWLPSFAYVLTGYALASRHELAWSRPRPNTWLARLGRHSLVFYFLHQPVILLALYFAGVVSFSDFV